LAGRDEELAGYTMDVVAVRIMIENENKMAQAK
jgi:hypothetical protein